MSVRQIMASAAIVCSVPDERKAVAVRNSLEGPVTPGVTQKRRETVCGARVFMFVGVVALPAPRLGRRCHPCRGRA